MRKGYASEPWQGEKREYKMRIKGRIKSVKLICKNCGKYYHPFSHYIKTKSKFCSNKCQGEYYSEENSYNWKGNKVGYKQFHYWVNKKNSKPELCEDCGKSRKLELANISGKHTRDIKDYKWLCISCHRKLDKKIPKIYFQAKSLFEKGYKPLEISKLLNLKFPYVYRWKNGRYYGKTWLLI